MLIDSDGSNDSRFQLQIFFAFSKAKRQLLIIEGVVRWVQDVTIEDTPISYRI